MYYAGTVLLFLVLAYGFVPEVLTGKVVNQSDITGYRSMSQEAVTWNKAHPDVPTYWTDSMFGGMPTTSFEPSSDGDWTQSLYNLLMKGKRPANWLFISLLGAFLLMLSLGVDKVLAIGGAVAVTFCSYNFQIIQVGHNTKMQAIAFLPWVLAAAIFTYRSALRQTQREGWRDWLPKTLLGAVLFGFALSFQIKANHQQITYYLALMIVFVSSKIVVGRRTHQQGMYIDLQTLAEMEQERDRLEREVRERQRQEEIDWRSIRNQASNENALNEKLRDDRGTNAAALNEAAAEAEARMRANREAYEQGLAEERAIRERRGKEDGAERQDRKVKGRVTVSVSITDPVRTSRYLEVPAYLCEGGGDVTVSVTVDRAGKVTGARVTEGGDDCMRESALRAARNSLFNIDDSAPARQTGTITYIFIPQ